MMGVDLVRDDGALVLVGLLDGFVGSMVVVGLDLCVARELSGSLARALAEVDFRVSLGVNGGGEGVELVGGGVELVDGGVSIVGFCGVDVGFLF